MKITYNSWLDNTKTCPDFNYFFEKYGENIIKKQEYSPTNTTFYANVSGMSTEDTIEFHKNLIKLLRNSNFSENK